MGKRKKKSQGKRHKVTSRRSNANLGSKPTSAKRTINTEQTRRTDSILLVITGVAIFVLAQIAVTNPKALSLISLILGILSIGGLISPNTPIGRWLFLNHWPSNKSIERFYDWYRRSIIKTLQVLSIIAVYGVFSFFNFFSIHLTAIMGAVILFIVGIFSLINNGKNHWQVITIGLIISIIIFGTAHISHKVIEAKSLDSTYISLYKRMLKHGRKSPTDPMVLLADNISKYQELYLIYYDVKLSAVRLMFHHQKSNQQLELWNNILPSQIKSTRDALEHRFKFQWNQLSKALHNDQGLIEFTKANFDASKKKS